MRRADRLFQIIQILRRGCLTTARALAEELEVSARTVYRDIADLIGSGVPIEGAAGAGYLLRGGYDLPPLMFSQTELEALVLGARIVASWADPSSAARPKTSWPRSRRCCPWPCARAWPRCRCWHPAIMPRRLVRSTLPRCGAWSASSARSISTIATATTK